MKKNNVVPITSATSTTKPCKKLTDEQRFKKSVAKRNANGCELWTGCLAQNGYGIVGVAGKNLYAHRYAYQLAHGPIPNHSYACHHCDVRNCVRASHLFLGDAKANAVDKQQKGRSTKGRVCPRVPFTEAEIDQIIDLFASGVSQYKIAATLGRAQPVIAEVRKRNRAAIDLKRIRLQFADALEALQQHIAPSIASLEEITPKAA